MTDNREALYHKVRSLLKKAESTTIEAEANAFIQKAQELIMRHAIDEEALWANDPTKREHITTLDIEIQDRKQGAQEKRKILHSVASANRCRMWYKPGASVSTVAGYDTDLVFVEMLYRSIFVQMNFKMAIAQAVSPHIHAKTFANSFLQGFSRRISERLAATTRKSTATVENEQAGNSLVLLDRATKVSNWVDERIKLRTARTTQSSNVDYDAYSHGKRAADETDISGGRGTVTRGKQKQIGR